MYVVVAFLLAAGIWKLLGLIFSALAFVFWVLTVVSLFAVLLICSIALWMGPADPDARSSRRED